MLRRLFIVLQCFCSIPILIFFYKIITYTIKYGTPLDSFSFYGLFVDYPLVFIFPTSESYFSQSFTTLFFLYFLLSTILSTISYGFIILVKWIVYGKLQLYKIGED